MNICLWKYEEKNVKWVSEHDKTQPLGTNDGILKMAFNKLQDRCTCKWIST